MINTMLVVAGYTLISVGVLSLVCKVIVNL